MLVCWINSASFLTIGLIRNRSCFDTDIVGVGTAGIIWGLNCINVNKHVIKENYLFFLNVLANLSDPRHNDQAEKYFAYLCFLNCTIVSSGFIL